CGGAGGQDAAAWPSFSCGEAAPGPGTWATGHGGLNYPPRARPNLWPGKNRPLVSWRPHCSVPGRYCTEILFKYCRSHHNHQGCGAGSRTAEGP
ncbi:unnamed protein product, partial [Gulo gulo]